MSNSKIAPTKTNLLEYRDQLKFSTDGRTLLEQKREVLVIHLVDIITQVREQREKLNELMMKSFKLIKMLEIEIGEFELERVIHGVKRDLQIEIIEKSIMGVTIPTIRKKRIEGKESSPKISISSTTLTFDELSRSISEILSLIFIVAQVEVSAWRLSYEIKKTQTRVNALENIFIPEFKETVKFIQDTLEEREREAFFQMKRIKNAIEEREE